MTEKQRTLSRIHQEALHVANGQLRQNAIARTSRAPTASFLSFTGGKGVSPSMSSGDEKQTVATLSSHVLNTAAGCPGEQLLCENFLILPGRGITVALYQGAKELASKMTNHDGRVSNGEFPALEPGTYRCCKWSSWDAYVSCSAWCFTLEITSLA